MEKLQHDPMHDVIRARFLEAADVDRRTPAGRTRPGTASAFWPGYQHSFEEMAQWGEKRLAEERAMQALRVPPLRAEHDRANEVLDWTRTILKDSEQRKVLWMWAFHHVYDRPFSKWIERTGRVPRTTYYRIDAALKKISARFHSDGVWPSLPGEKWLAQVQPETATTDGTIGEVASGPKPSPTSVIYGDKAKAQPLTDAYMADLAKHMRKVNKRRRAEQDRRAAEVAA